MEQLPDNSKAIAYAHLGHISKQKGERELQGTSTSSMGYYLFQKYGQKYTTVGLFAGSGTTWTGRYYGYDLSDKRRVYPVLSPIGKSVEQLCLLMNKSSFYLNNISEFPLLDRIDSERSMGQYWQPMQFEPVDLRKELDAIWFTKESTAL